MLVKKLLVCLLLSYSFLICPGQTSEEFLERGNAKAKLKEYPGAIADFTKAILINPNSASAYYSRGIIKNELKDFKGAIQDFGNAIRINLQPLIPPVANQTMSGIKIEAIMAVFSLSTIPTIASEKESSFRITNTFISLSFP